MHICAHAWLPVVGGRGDIFEDDSSNTGMGRLCSPLLVGSHPEILSHRDYIYFAIHLTLGQCWVRTLPEFSLTNVNLCQEERPKCQNEEPAFLTSRESLSCGLQETPSCSAVPGSQLCLHVAPCPSQPGQAQCPSLREGQGCLKAGRPRPAPTAPSSFPLRGDCLK